MFVVVDDVGDHALSEQSVLWSPGELSWAHFSYHDSHKLSRYFSLWRPLALLPFSLPCSPPVFFPSPANCQDHGRFM